MRCAIIDDDELSRTVLSRYIETHDSLHLVFTAASGVEAARELRNHSVDLLYLDVEMPEITGLDLIRALDSPPLVILVTGNAEYAVEAFELDVVHFLVKPVEYADFLRATARARRRIASALSRGPNRHFFAPIDGRLTQVDLTEVLRFEAQDDVVVMHTTRRSHRLPTTMKALEERLPPDAFVRVHRSHIVRIDRIVDIEETNLVIGREVIPISGNRRRALTSRVNRL
jgi:two-component system, LytTR family, response regulator